MTDFVQRVALFGVRLTLLVVTAIAVMAVEFENGLHVSDVGSPLVAFHRLEWVVLPLLAVGWVLERGASRALRREREAS